MKTLSVVDVTAEPVPLAAVERLPAAVRAVVLPFPPARDGREFGRLAKAVKRAKVAAVVVHPLLCRPCWAKVMEWLASGVLGALESLEVDFRGACSGAAVPSSSRPFPAAAMLWPALDFALRLPSGLPPLFFQENAGAVQQVCSAAAAGRPAPMIRLTWRPPQGDEPAEQLRLSAANGRLELVAGHPFGAVVRLILSSGHEVTETFSSETVAVQLAMAWAHHAAVHGLDGGALGVARLAPLYGWLARA